MRITSEERREIKQAAYDIYGPDAVVRVFGSRADDSKRGGDLDLHIEIDPVPRNVWDRFEFRRRVREATDELHLDLIITRRGWPLSGIERLAYEEGVVL